MFCSAAISHRIWTWFCYFQRFMLRLYLRNQFTKTTFTLPLLWSFPMFSWCLTIANWYIQWLFLMNARATVGRNLLRIIFHDACYSLCVPLFQIELSLNPGPECLHNLGSCHLEVAPALELIHWKNIFRLSPPPILLLHSNDVPCRSVVSLNLKIFEFWNRNHTGEMK